MWNFTSCNFINLFVLCLNLQLRWKDSNRENPEKDKTGKFPSKLQLEIFFQAIHLQMFLICFNMFLLLSCCLIDQVFPLPYICLVRLMPKHYAVLLVKKNYLFNFFYTFFLHNNVLIFQLGRNKVFLRAGQIAILDSRRAEVLDNASKIIQSRFRTFIARKEFNLIRVTAITLQAYCRGIIFVFYYQLILSNFVIIII